MEGFYAASNKKAPGTVVNADNWQDDKGKVTVQPFIRSRGYGPVQQFIILPHRREGLTLSSAPVTVTKSNTFFGMRHP